MNWTPENIIALANSVLIPLFSFIIILVFLRKFDQEIRRFLAKMTKAEGELGNSGLRIGFHSEQRLEHDKEELNTQTAPQEMSDHLASDKVHINDDIGIIYDDLAKTIETEDINIAKSKLESLVKQFDGDKKQCVYLKTFFLMSTFLKGNHQDIFTDFKRLYDAYSDAESKFLIVESWTFCYSKLKLYKESEKIIATLLDSVTDNLIKTKLICLLSTSISSSGDHSRARNTILSRLATQNDNQERALLYNALSTTEYNADNKTMGALCLGKKADCSPEDLSALFDAAYQQSQTDLNSISLFNYSRLISANPNHDIALNNIGVTARNLNLKTKAVEFQSRASRLNASIACANLGYAYLDAGFVEEAKSMAEKGLALNSPHENNYSLMTNIKNQSDEENDIWEKHIKASEKHKSFTDKYIAAYYSLHEAQQNFSGKWQTKENTIFSVTVDGNKLTATWKTHGYGLGLQALYNTQDATPITTTWSLTGNTVNNSAIISLTSSHENSTILTTPKKNLFSYIDNETDEWIVFNTDIKDPFTETYKRAPK